MTNERIIELLEIEKKCVLRNSCGECNRYCAGCDLLQDDTELHEMYEKAIGLLNDYGHVLELAKKMHTWIFLHTVDEYEVYDELGLTEEDNALLGSLGKFVITSKKRKRDSMD